MDANNMEWYTAIMIVGSNLVVTITLFLWARHEAATDRRDVYAILKGIQDEMRDFHGRLCAIEERNKR